MDKLKGTLCASPERGEHRHIPQQEWKCPPKLTLDSNWSVAAGQESTEAGIQRRVPTDPRPYAALLEPTDHSDSEIAIIPIIPIEEEGNLLNNSSAPFLTTSAMNSETMSLVIDAVGALNSVALGQGEPPVGLGLFMQWLNTETVRKFFNGQSFTGIESFSMQKEPTKSVPFVSSNPDQFYCVGENTGVAIPKPIGWTSSVPAHDVLDMDLLAGLLHNRGDIEKLMKIYDATAEGKSRAMETIPESSHTFPREISAPGHSSRCTTGASFAPPKTVPSVVSARNNMRLINDDIRLPEATMAPMSPLYSSPSTNWVSDMETERLINNDIPLPEATMAPMSPLYISPSTNWESDRETERLINDDIPLPEATMAPMSPLYSSPSTNWESVMATERLINEYGNVAGMRMKTSISPLVTFSLPQTESLQPTTNGLRPLLHRNPPLSQMHTHPVSGQTAPIPMPRTQLLTSMGPDPFLWTALATFVMVNQQPAANTIHHPSAFSHSTPPMNCSLLHANTQIVRQGPSKLNPHQKPCMYYNTRRGCRNGASCPYQHSKFDQASPS